MVPCHITPHGIDFDSSHVEIATIWSSNGRHINISGVVRFYKYRPDIPVPDETIYGDGRENLAFFLPDVRR